ncbi:lipoyl(octanoyl) transferase LipB [Lysinibacter sp. HNR]|uniref:lipoyl(octanoyl) transferase LipB n=1 Tax=Lysinibacter sp. HNR TaxID=3031408 RepID=UPI002435904A|nr:lipoyl(octanoyl) transferase LipB [Lysinibacter sp. HNR]WGD38410.1 lipoyl(octanoyl) transferase LipB [Lysinibacter sp. HNR]
MVSFLTPGYAPSYLDYSKGLDLQRVTHRAVADNTCPNSVILCEHNNVYTAGSRTEEKHRPSASHPIPVIDVDRGGSITWHGPGQLIGYPIVRLPEAKNVVGFVRLLESALINALSDHGIVGKRVHGRSGVWIASSTGHNKIAAIGLRVSRGVTMHGFALNCSNSLTPYEHITACGISDAGVTTVSLEAQRIVSPTDIAPSVTTHLASALASFGIGETTALHTENAALRR